MGQILARQASGSMSAVSLHLVKHPVALDALAELRHQATRPAAFRAAAHRISTVVATEALRDLPSEPGEVLTPLGPAPVFRLANDLVLAPVLRAGLGMLEAVLALVPGAEMLRLDVGWSPEGGMHFHLGARSKPTASRPRLR